MTTYCVAARSQNTNSFGLRGYIFVDINGNACEACSGHFDHYEGDRVEVGSGDPETAFANAGYEIPYNKSKCLPNVVKQIWKVHPKERKACKECKNVVLAEALENELCPRCQPAPERDPNAFDVVGFIMAYEDGQLGDDAIISGFQHLIDEGTCWSLQGHYGRTANNLIKQGLCKDTHGVIKHRDAVLA